MERALLKIWVTAVGRICSPNNLLANISLCCHQGGEASRKIQLSKNACVRVCGRPGGRLYLPLQQRAGVSGMNARTDRQSYENAHHPPNHPPLTRRKFRVEYPNLLSCTGAAGTSRTARAFVQNAGTNRAAPADFFPPVHHQPTW